jgi:hypothetical protein
MDAPVTHPLGPPTVTGSTITVDTMLQQPTRITRMIMDLTLQRFIADRVFSSGGGVTGGAVIYDEVQENELYTSRDVKEIAPGQEFPLITSERLTPKVATVRKWGGKTFITDEAKDRNDNVRFTNQLRQLSNTIVRKINAVAVDTLQKKITEKSRTVIGNDWSAVITTGTSATTSRLMPAHDFGRAQQIADQEELGIVYDLWLLNPQEYLSLSDAYQDRLTNVLDAHNVSIYVSNRVPAGSAYVVASGQVGQMRIEQPLRTVTWREEETERTFVQSGVRPLMFVYNPFAVLEFTGLHG